MFSIQCKFDRIAVRVGGGVWSVRELVRGAERHLHQEGSPVRGRQRVETIAVQQRERLLPLLSAHVVQRGVQRHRVIPEAVRLYIRRRDDHRRRLWIRHRLSDRSSNTGELMNN